MNRKFVCSKEVTLSQQVADDEKFQISDIFIEGRLCGSDLMLLSDMSKHGNLRKLDMHGVIELDTDNPKESLLIDELEVKGYLDGEDDELLTKMSGEKGCFILHEMEEILF